MRVCPSRRDEAAVLALTPLDLFQAFRGAGLEVDELSVIGRRGSVARRRGGARRAT